MTGLQSARFRLTIAEIASGTHPLRLLDVEHNVSFGATKLPQLAGQATSIK
jgi:hypothetical protein